MRLPFVIKATKKLAAYAEAKGYTENQILNASVSTVLSLMDIPEDSKLGKKYVFFEAIIKSHVIQILFPTPPSMLDSITSVAYGINPDAEIVQNGNIITITGVI